MEAATGQDDHPKEGTLMDFAIPFLIGALSVWLFYRVMQRVGKTSIGKKTGIGAKARKKFLAELDHDKLLTFHEDVLRELERRRTPLS
jgi:hypothetical protein